MAMQYLDHVNIRTTNLESMSRFYSEVMGLERGPRPPFSIGGAWHYCGDKAAVHIVEVQKQPQTGEPQVEHFAFRAEGMAGFVETLKQHNIDYSVAIVPDVGIQQVNIYDPDGNHIEIQFLAGDTVD